MRNIAAKLGGTALAICLAVSLSASNVEAKKKRNDDAAAAAVGIIALGVLGAALADHHHRTGRPSYRPHPAYHPTENAVGHCVHRAKGVAKRQGAYRLQVNQIDRVRQRGDGTMRVVFRATGFYPSGAVTSRVRCTVYGDQVIDFDYS